MTCRKLANLLRSERPALKEEFERHKYFLSQQENRDVGIRYAERDFIQNHLNDWAEGYKKCYCQLVCKEGCS